MKKDGNFVLRKSAYLLSAIACTMMIASCGGGNSSTSTPTPTPSSTATATPSPTPTPTALNFDFAHDFGASSSFLYISAYFTPSSGGGATFSDASINNSSQGTITYTASPQSVTFQYPDQTSGVTFDSSTLTNTTATELDFQNSTGQKLSLVVPYGNVMRATFEQTDPYTQNTTTGTLLSDRVALFYNPVTDTNAISSPLSYTGNFQVVGGTPQTTPPGAVSVPSETFQIDASGNLTGTLPISVTSNGSTTQVANFSVSGTVSSSNTFNGTLSDSSSGFSGNFLGTLAGPNREEMLFVFSVSNSDGRKFVGSFIGH